MMAIFSFHLLYICICVAYISIYICMYACGIRNAFKVKFNPNQHKKKEKKNWNKDQKTKRLNSKKLKKWEKN